MSAAIYLPLVLLLVSTFSEDMIAACVSFLKVGISEGTLTIPMTHVLALFFANDLYHVAHDIISFLRVLFHVWKCIMHSLALLAPSCVKLICRTGKVIVFWPFCLVTMLFDFVEYWTQLLFVLTRRIALNISWWKNLIVAIWYEPK